MSDRRIDRYLVEPFGDHHHHPGFSCGVEALDRYFYQQASQDRRRGMAMPYVLMDSTTGTVVGYHTLSSSAMLPADLPHEMARRLPRYEMFPAILLGRLAVDHRYRGQGFGGALLLDALRRCLDTSQQIGVMAVVVDAQDEAAKHFYQHYQFRTFEDHEHRLHLPMTEVSRL